MPWYLHVFWGAVVYAAAARLGHGVAAAGEWVAKAIMKNAETQIAWQREHRALGGRRPDRA